MKLLLGVSATLLGLAVLAAVVLSPGCKKDADSGRVLHITSVPQSDAMVVINGIYRGHTPLSVPGLPPGPVALYLDREGFRRTRRTVEVPEEGEASVEIQLDPLVGYLSVNSDPPLAKVILDGERVLGETPLNSSVVPIGEHTYQVVKERYEPAEKTFTVEENFRYKHTHKLTLKPSTLIVYSYPTGAQIRLNTLPQAERTPTRFELPPGLYTVAISAKGFTTRETRVELKATEEKTVDVRLAEGQTPEGMVLVPAGEFIRGADKTSPDERPKTKTYLDAFYIDRFEVTNEQFKLVFSDHKFDGGEAKYPVTGVTWKDAKKYAQTVGKRLPSEEEWEKAARGDDGREYPWGNKYEKRKCNSGESVDAMLREVGKYLEGASTYGCMDMAGNAYEWTDSWYQAYPGNQEINTKYGQVFRVLRGGSYKSNQFDVRCARRHYNSVDAAHEDYGFRCAKDIE